MKNILGIYKSSNTNDIVGVLFYSPKYSIYHIEINDHYSEKLPAVFSFYKRGKCIDPIAAGQWVKDRVIPNDRENIDKIIKKAGLKKYDEFKLLKYTKGRSTQDDFFLEKIDYNKIPLSVKKRMNNRIQFIIPMGKYLVIVFKDSKAIEINMSFFDKENVRYRKIYDSIKANGIESYSTLPDGLGLYWGDISNNCLYTELYKDAKKRLPKELLTSFLKTNIIGSADAEEILGCSRQHLSQLVKEGVLKPVHSINNSNVFLKTEVLDYFADKDS